MMLEHPTHVITITVWEPATHTTEYRQVWVDAGPFPEQSPTAALLTALDAYAEFRTEYVQVQTSRTTADRERPAPWEQLKFPEMS